MMTPDIVNGLFELFGGVFISASIIRLYHDKIARGISWMHIGFFSAWGFWNLFYYPHLDQWVSFIGGIGVVGANTIYLGMIVYYEASDD